MARGPSTSAFEQRNRAGRKPYEDRGKIIASLGYSYTDAAFDKWRDSSLVKPWWEVFVSKFLKADLYKPGNSVPTFDHLYARIRDKEWRGRIGSLGQTHFPRYHNETDWHSWLLHRLVVENTGDREGCFYYWGREDVETVFRTAYHYILFAKWERATALTRSKSTRSPKTNPKAITARNPAPSSDDSDAGECEPTLGLAYVRWTEGRPLGARLAIEIESFRSYSLEGFLEEINQRFGLSHRKQRCKALVAEDDQACPAKYEVVVFTLETEDIEVPEEIFSDDDRVFR
ncbi:hypothetical protein J4E90_006139 [Alternaria incomplexa]|uniref:uncharacterized protein n=1 Tax=Alternaria incomplexa TaxID=1187928 RepID=UPI00221E4CE4|nr:uncharacterized protein J4E90_006139 [Alternaria incomplexa]KAI4912733.1 hypothetical protein J4E90_006139 [Alternaria incomplexa]